MKIKKEWKFGIINEDEFSLSSPRMVDEWYETFPEAFEGAGDMIENGVGQVAIVRCRYNPKTDCWYEVVGAGTVQINAEQWVEDEQAEAA